MLEMIGDDIFLQNPETTLELGKCEALEDDASGACWGIGNDIKSVLYFPNEAGAPKRAFRMKSQCVLGHIG